MVPVVPYAVSCGQAVTLRVKWECDIFPDGQHLPLVKRAWFMNNRNARLGFALFSIYLVLYGGFVFINAFAPSLMELTPLAGVNLAVWYGFGLIVAALALALIYGWVASNPADDQIDSQSSAGGTNSGESDR